MPLEPFKYADAKGNYVAALSEGGRLLLFIIDELKYQPRGRGVNIMGLDEEDKLFAAVIHNQPDLIVKGKLRGDREKETRLKGDKLAHYFLKRARMGRVVSGVIISTALVVPED
jgi:topoisomerase IV subunit A